MIMFNEIKLRSQKLKKISFGEIEHKPLAIAAMEAFNDRDWLIKEIERIHDIKNGKTCT